MKYVVFLGDGMADEPFAELGDRTPLDVANHPMMDMMAQAGRFGLTKTIPAGMQPGSDTANLAVFGFDPAIYYSGRSPLEAASLGVPLNPTDVTYRMNFVTLSDPAHPETALMTDYSAGEISSEESHALVAALNERFRSDTVEIVPGFSYRHCLVLRDAADGAVLTPPHDISGRPAGDKLPAGTNAELLNAMIRFAGETLPNHPVNRARVAAGKNPANAVWFWGEGRRPALRPFSELYGLRGAVVSAVDLIQGIGKCAGLEVLKVPGATGTYLTNFAGKAEAAIDAFSRGLDYVYIHVEAPDECGHHRQVCEKVYAIEQIDGKILSPVLGYLAGTGEPYCALVMPDHPTPLARMTHTSDPVPFAIYRSGDSARRAVRFTERDAAGTGVFVPEAHTLLSCMLNR